MSTLFALPWNGIPIVEDNSLCRATYYGNMGPKTFLRGRVGTAATGSAELSKSLIEREDIRVPRARIGGGSISEGALHVGQLFRIAYASDTGYGSLSMVSDSAARFGSRRT